MRDSELFAGCTKPIEMTKVLEQDLFDKNAISVDYVWLISYGEMNY